MISIDQQKCNGCGACMDACSTGAIYMVDERASVDAGVCNECVDCVNVCPNNAIQLERIVLETTQQSVQSSEKHEITAELKSNVIKIGKTLLPLAISGIADLIISKIEKSDKPVGLSKQSDFTRGKQTRQRRRRGREEKT
ncbi:4Fe-4S dicluster domain-containing protein [candidate division KSB1 bacterium]|nr:4Fe-4S dicluster domain-containing protein [candidate division KSB1 bacterium]